MQYMYCFFSINECNIDLFVENRESSNCEVFNNLVLNKHAFKLKNPLIVSNIPIVFTLRTHIV